MTAELAVWKILKNNTWGYEQLGISVYQQGLWRLYYEGYIFCLYVCACLLQSVHRGRGVDRWTNTWLLPYKYTVSFESLSTIWKWERWDQIYPYLCLVCGSAISLYSSFDHIPLDFFSSGHTLVSQNSAKFVLWPVCWVLFFFLPNSESLLWLLEKILRGSFSHEKCVGNIFLIACFVLLNLFLQKKKNIEEVHFSESTEQITHAQPRSWAIDTH